jgi:hypothetical protein
MPNNHAILPPGPAAEPSERSPHASTGGLSPDDPTIIDLLGRIVAEIVGLRHDLALADKTADDDSAAPQSPVSDAEFKRRIELLVSTAKLTAGGKLICERCGKNHSTSGNFRSHLKRYHAQEIKELPAASFK